MPCLILKITRTNILPVYITSSNKHTHLALCRPTTDTAISVPCNTHKNSVKRTQCTGENKRKRKYFRPYQRTRNKKRAINATTKRVIVMTKSAFECMFKCGEGGSALARANLQLCYLQKRAQPTKMSTATALVISLRAFSASLDGLVVHKLYSFQCGSKPLHPCSGAAKYRFRLLLAVKDYFLAI